MRSRGGGTPAPSRTPRPLRLSFHAGRRAPNRPDTVRRVRTVFLGTSDFAVIVLGALAASSHRPALVVTRPDRPRGRGRRVLPPPVADAARDLGLELFQPKSVNSEEARARISAAQPQMLCVCA